MNIYRVEFEFNNEKYFIDVSFSDPVDLNNKDDINMLLSFINTKRNIGKFNNNGTAELQNIESTFRYKNYNTDSINFIRSYQLDNQSGGKKHRIVKKKHVSSKKKTDKKIKVNSRVHNVFVGPRGGHYIKKNGEFVSVKL